MNYQYFTNIITTKNNKRIADNPLTRYRYTTGNSNTVRSCIQIKLSATAPRDFKTSYTKNIKILKANLKLFMFKSKNICHTKWQYYTGKIHSTARAKERVNMSPTGRLLILLWIYNGGFTVRFHENTITIKTNGLK